MKTQPAREPEDEENNSDDLATRRIGAASGNGRVNLPVFSAFFRVPATTLYRIKKNRAARSIRRENQESTA